MNSREPALSACFAQTALFRWLCHSISMLPRFETVYYAGFGRIPITGGGVSRLFGAVAFKPFQNVQYILLSRVCVKNPHKVPVTVSVYA